MKGVASAINIPPPIFPYDVCRGLMHKKSIMSRFYLYTNISISHFLSMTAVALLPYNSLGFAYFCTQIRKRRTPHIPCLYSLFRYHGGDVKNAELCWRSSELYSASIWLQIDIDVARQYSGNYHSEIWATNLTSKFTRRLVERDDYFYFYWKTMWSFLSRQCCAQQTIEN